MIIVLTVASRFVRCLTAEYDEEEFNSIIFSQNTLYFTVSSYFSPDEINEVNIRLSRLYADCKQLSAFRVKETNSNVARQEEESGLRTIFFSPRESVDSSNERKRMKDPRLCLSVSVCVCVCV